MNTIEITISARSYEDSDTGLTDAARDYTEEHGLESWEVEARWADDQRREIILTVPALDPSETKKEALAAQAYTSDTAQRSGPWARRSRD